MNKQQLASKIWESANKMRSKIEANEYKDYILGFIFYKFLSDQQIKYLLSENISKEELKELTEDNKEVVKFTQRNLGYFISYKNLFSTWIEIKNDFDVSNVRDALQAFDRLINKAHQKVFSGIFDTLETGLSKLGDNSKSQTKAVSDLIYLIKDIPMNEKADYDILGFVYEYLISNFAANAGKKAGEFYTPHEVSVLMSEIIAHDQKHKKEIEIYDPTSGSGSLLINIGKSISQYINEPNKIKYYAQELKQNTYNLTRMNLIMRGILPDNIVTRNGDTLEDDWPYFDESDPENTYNTLYADAVVSNPPYSQKWDSLGKEADARFKSYGLAPKGKADYAFLLHDLFHLKSDGIMTIVLPHGVLFRGGEEKTIRQNLIEKNNIETIIGLPSNIFFGTGIPTIIMILRKKRTKDDIQIIDASKGFIKDGKNNKLRACDIKKIVDAVINRSDIEKYSRVISRREIRENDFNLNIPRYVDSSTEIESFDIYASMFGGIPEKELNKYNEYFKVFPNLKDTLFNKTNESYYEISTTETIDFIKKSFDMKNYSETFRNNFHDLDKYLYKELLENPTKINISSMESVLSDEIFQRINNVPLIDKYQAYQLLDNEWLKISIDLELIQKEGMDSCKKVDPNIVVKKKNGKEVEVQDGWIGRIIPFELIQKVKFPDELEKQQNYENRLSEISSLYKDIIESLSEEDKVEISDLLNDNDDAFVFKEIIKEAKKIIDSKIKLTEEMLEYKIVQVKVLNEEEKELKKLAKQNSIYLHEQSKIAIENLQDEEVTDLLKMKWIDPLIHNINNLEEQLINDFAKEIDILAKKYNQTLIDIEDEITKTEKELSQMLSELTGNEYDLKGLQELQKLLSGEDNE